MIPIIITNNMEALHAIDRADRGSYLKTLDRYTYLHQDHFVTISGRAFCPKKLITVTMKKVTANLKNTIYKLSSPIIGDCATTRMANRTTTYH